MKILKPEDMPAPDALIDYGDGVIMPAMFHYAETDADLSSVTLENGFEGCTISMEENAPDLFEEYSERGLNLSDFPNWRPIAPEGFTFAGCWDTEDGPHCFYLKPLEKDEAA
jgi:hypothetical protein